MAPCTRGLRKNLEKRLVTSSRSAARSVNASTFVKHLTTLLLSNLGPGILILLPSAKKNLWKKEGLICVSTYIFRLHATKNQTCTSIHRRMLEAPCEKFFTTNISF